MCVLFVGVYFSCLLVVRSGPGVAGICLARLGADPVVLTDLPHVLPLIRQSIEWGKVANNIVGMECKWGDMDGQYDEVRRR
jgi:predicted nicotinamide N-methyase